MKFLFSAVAALGLIFQFSSLEIGKDREWIHCVPMGAWRGHPRGTFSITEVECAQIIENFERAGLEVPIDWEHQTQLSVENGQPAPAAGWIDRLEARANGIWGHVRRWTEVATAQLDREEYRYLSPVITFKTIDRITGKPTGAALQSAALTNVPFFTNLVPLSGKAQGEHLMNPALLALLGLTENASDEEVGLAIKRLIERAALGALVCSTNGWKDGAIPADAEQRVKEQLAHKGYVPFADHMAALGQAEAKFSALSDQQLIDQAASSGKVAPAQMTAFRQMVTSDRRTAETWLHSTVATVPVKTPVDPARIPEPGTAAQLDGIDQAICSQLKLDAAKFKNQIKEMR